jgi:two-component sensor histidine kinase
VEDIPLDIDTIIPLGLIINEMVTNALTHGFPRGYAGRSPGIKPEIRIRTQCSKTKSRCCLTVSDNGQGLPENFNWNQSETLGMFIIRSLVEQLNGTLKVRGAEPVGTEFHVEFQIHKKWTRKENE